MDRSWRCVTVTLAHGSIAVFGQKYHPQLKCNMSKMHECWSVFQRLKLSPDERLETYVRQHDIVDIEFNHAEYDKDDDVCVCVDLSFGQRGPFPILRLTKACWTYPPSKELDYYY